MPRFDYRGLSETNRAARHEARRLGSFSRGASARFRLLSSWGCSTLCHLVEPGLPKKVTIVQGEDIKLLRRIVAGGGRKYTCLCRKSNPTGT
jgi:hypothetical protein